MRQTAFIITKKTNDVKKNNAKVIQLFFKETVRKETRKASDIDSIGFCDTINRDIMETHW